MGLHFRVGPLAKSRAFWCVFFPAVLESNVRSCHALSDLMISQHLQDKFGLTFPTTLFEEFNQTYQSFKTDLIELDVDLQELIALKPKSLPRFPALSSIGSKKPSVAYNLQLRELLWDKLVDKFPSPMYNGVRVPGLAIGKTFNESFPVRGMFPVQVRKD